MAIKFNLTIKCFKKNRKKKSLYQALYIGEIKVQKRDDVIDIVLKGEGGDLPVRVRWDSHADQIFCLANFDKKEKVRFILKTKLPTGESISSFSVGGQDADTGKFINWSASILF